MLHGQDFRAINPDRSHSDTIEPSRASRQKPPRLRVSGWGLLEIYYETQPKRSAIFATVKHHQ